MSPVFSSFEVVLS